MIETDRLAAYLAARSILALTPGPGIADVTTRTIAGGTREGVCSALARKLTGTRRRRQQLAIGSGMFTLEIYVAAH